MVSRVFVLAEDRPHNEVGLRLALTSLFRHLPDARVVAYWPCVTEAFRGWAAQFHGLTLIPRSPENASSWNCKPQAILPLLEGEFDEAIWLDSDMLVTRDPSPYFDHAGRGTIVSTEDFLGQAHPGSVSICDAWGVKPGRDLPISINSSVLRVTREHIALLQRWKECLADQRYVEAQQRVLHERPRHLWGDQDVLFMLLGSEEFAAIPLHYLRVGIDVIHCGGALGYSSRRRLRGIFRQIPTFLHAIAGKPWWVLTPDYRRAFPFWFTFYRGLLQETSPYVREATQYREELGLNCDWMDYRSPVGGLLRFLGCGHYALRGLPLSLIASAVVARRRLLRR